MTEGDGAPARAGSNIDSSGRIDVSFLREAGLEESSRRAAPKPRSCSARWPNALMQGLSRLRIAPTLIKEGAMRIAQPEWQAWFHSIAAPAWRRLLGALASTGAGRAGSGTGDAAAAAANAFLTSLPAELRKTASFPLEFARNALSWYFVPSERVGVSLLKLDDAQSELLGPLLATALSPEGLLTARGVHQAREHPAPRRDRGGCRQCLAPRSRPVLHRRVRQAAGDRALGVALRRPPPLAQRDSTSGRSRQSSRRCSWAPIRRACSRVPMPVFGCWPLKKISAAS